jgi:3alpha(or 20beta)-hydroxysteroid dehydrogenase
VRGLTKSQAYELGPAGIRVCSVHPGGMDTRMGNPNARSKDELNVSYSVMPLQRIGEAEEVARVILFVASDDASYVTGAEIAADGGWSAGYFQPILPGAPASLTDAP